MTLTVVRNEPEPLVLGPEASPRTYYLKVPAAIERAKWRHAVAAQGGRFHGQIGLLDGLKRGVQTVMASSPPDILEAVVEHIDLYRAAMLDFAKDSVGGAYDNTADPEVLRAFTESLARLGALGRSLAVYEMETVAAYPPYAQMVADDQVYWTICGIEGVKLFLKNYDGLTVPFSKLPGGVPETVLAAIPESDLEQIGRKVEDMSRLSAVQRRNFPLPPSTSAGGSTSTPGTTETNGNAVNSESDRSSATP